MLLLIALVVSVAVKTFFLQGFYIPSRSMEPEFVENDRILVQKVSYWGSAPSRGDIIVFKDPGGWLPREEAATNPVARIFAVLGLHPTAGYVVKRVIGIGGDRVACCDEQDRLTVNGRALDETGYLPQGVRPSSFPFDVEVPRGTLWVMGDNRGSSADSRAHMGGPGGGYVPAADVVGKVWARIWPWKRVGLIRRPAAFADLVAP